MPLVTDWPINLIYFGYVKLFLEKRMSNARKDRRAAFVRGFWSGLAGSMRLFGEPSYTEPAKIEVKKLHRSISDPDEAMRADWEQVGADLRAAFKQVGMI